MNSGLSRRCMFQTQASPSGSLTARGFLLYEATQSSGYCEAFPADHQRGRRDRRRKTRYFRRPVDVCDRTSPGPAVVRERADELERLALVLVPGQTRSAHSEARPQVERRCLQGVLAAGGVIADVVVAVAQGALDDLGRVLDKLEETRSGIDLGALILGEI